MSGEIDIRRRGRGRFRVRIGPVAFDVETTLNEDGSIHCDKSFAVFVAPATWEQVCDRIKGMSRFDRAEGQRG